MNGKLSQPYLNCDDFSWMGLQGQIVNNWNPWINSNVLVAFLILEKDQKVRTQAVEKCMESIDKFIDVYFEDGGCDEGPSYWGAAGASLFDTLEVLYYVSEGKINVYDKAIIKNIGRYIYRVNISENYYVNFADASAIVKIPAQLVYHYGLRIDDQKLKDIGIYSFHLNNANSYKMSQGMIFRKISDVMGYDEIKSLSAKAPLPVNVWLDGIQVLISREKEGATDGLYLAAKGGHNQESHNHNDIGQFVIFSDGQPVLIDIGVETYTAKTFSPQRYEIWTMQSAYHNLPTVNGVNQSPGKNFKAKNVSYKSEDNITQLSMSIAEAYPEEAKIKEWNRSFMFNKKNKGSIEIIDDFTLIEASNDIVFNFITCCEHVINDNNILFKVTDGTNVELVFNDQVIISSEKIVIVDDKLKKVWPEYLYKIILRLKCSKDKGKIAFNLNQV